MKVRTFKFSCTGESDDGRPFSAFIQVKTDRIDEIVSYFTDFLIASKVQVKPGDIKVIQDGQ